MKSIDVPNLSRPIWPAALTRVARQRDRALAERDSARNVAVRLEQEVAALRHVLVVLGYHFEEAS